MARGKDLLGKTPGKDFADTHEPFSTIKVGVITRVDPLNMKADIRVLTGGGDRVEVDLTQPMQGPRSFFGGIPEVNSMCLVGYRRKHKQLHEAVILGYLPVGKTSGLRFDPFSGINMAEVAPEDMAEATKLYGSTIRYKRVKGNPGDIMGMSAEGAEFHLSRDARFFNRAGDQLELRDADRTFLVQSIHSLASDGGSTLVSGPIRRGMLNLPRDIFQVQNGVRTRVLKGPDQGYFGRDELQNVGPKPNSFSNEAYTVLDRINEDTEFPTTTYSNGREVYYVSARPAEAITAEGADSQVYTERRVEMRHFSNMQQTVLDDIDGFTSTAPGRYIELVYGTVVGNDPFGAEGVAAYGRVLKPSLFDEFDGRGESVRFRMNECVRTPGSSNGDEADTMGGAFFFQINQPDSAAPNNPFAVAVSKQGKLFMNVPGSRVENYDAKNVSAEIKTGGAVKIHLGASKPDNLSLHVTMEGGAHVEFGADSEGRSIDYTYRGSVSNTYRGSNGSNGVAHSMGVQGNSEKSVSGNDFLTVQGSVFQKVSGSYNIQATKVALTGLNGMALTSTELNVTVSGKSQFQHAALVTETIATGGRVSTILAGGEVHNILAGAYTMNVLAGATAFNNPAGAFAVTVGTGALSLTTAAGAVTISTAAGAMALSAGAGAVAITAGLACNITATIVSLIAPQVLLGGPPAVLGVVRGLPVMPPGAPSLDYITGLPIQGSAMVRSILCRSHLLLLPCSRLRS